MKRPSRGQPSLDSIIMYGNARRLPEWNRNMTFQYHAHASQLASRAFSFLSSKSDFACLQWYRWFVLPKSRPTLEISHWTTTKITEFNEDCFQSLHPVWVATHQLWWDHYRSCPYSNTSNILCAPKGYGSTVKISGIKRTICVDPNMLYNRLVQI